MDIPAVSPTLDGQRLAKGLLGLPREQGGREPFLIFSMNKISPNVALFLPQMSPYCCFSSSNSQTGEMTCPLTGFAWESGIGEIRGSAELLWVTCHPALPAHGEFPTSRLKWIWLICARRVNYSQSMSAKILD